MLNNVNYNIIDLDITNGQNGHRIAGGKDYIILLDSPVTAEVYITIGDRNNAKIPLKNDFAVKYQNGLEVYVYSTAVEGKKIKLATSNRLSSGIEIITNPQVDEIGNIGNIDSLNKINDISNFIDVNNNIPILSDSFRIPMSQLPKIETVYEAFISSVDGFLTSSFMVSIFPQANSVANASITLFINDIAVSACYAGSALADFQSSSNFSSNDYCKVPIKKGDRVKFILNTNNTIPPNYIFGLINCVTWNTQYEN